MANFSYKALNPGGALATGNIEAGGRQEAFRQIEALGLKPISLAEKAGAAKAAKPEFNFSFGGKKISFKMLENFTRLLASLLAAGVPLSRALVILYKETSNPIASEKWKEVHDLVVDGTSLADAMAKSPETFPKVYVAMVEAGEEGGFLDVVLGQISDFQIRQKELQSKVTAALVYPSVLLFLAVGVVIYMMVFFIPKFQTMFASFNAPLPAITRVIISISDIMRDYGLFVGIGIFVAGYATRQWLMTDKGRRSWEGLMLRLPVVGNLTAQFAMARFCRMLGTLLGAGVSLVNGLNVARKSIGNQILIDAMTNTIERVKKGDQMAVSLADCKQLFAGSTLEMISVAEESGRLDKELVRLAATTESELDNQLKMAVALMEPVLLFLIAALIGTIFIGMVLPIFSMQEYIN